MLQIIWLIIHNNAKLVNLFICIKEISYIRNQKGIYLNKNILELTRIIKAGSIINTDLHTALEFSIIPLIIIRYNVWIPNLIIKISQVEKLLALKRKIKNFNNHHQKDKNFKINIYLIHHRKNKGTKIVWIKAIIRWI